MLSDYRCCPRCLGDLIEQDRPRSREFACLQCGHSGEVLPAAEYVARKLELATARRKLSPHPSLSTA